MCSDLNTYPPPFQDRHLSFALLNAIRVFMFLVAGFVFTSFTLSAQTTTTTTLTSSPNPSCLNETITLTATVSESAATGNVHFWEGPILLGNAILGANGIATHTISNLSPGNHKIG